MKPVVIHSAARAELEEAMAFYEGRSRGLGADLQTKVEEAVAAIQQCPEGWPPHKRTSFRKYFVDRFPLYNFLPGPAGLHLDLSDCPRQPAPRLLEEAET